MLIYDNTGTWQTKRQILSIIADKTTKQNLMEIIPGLSKWKIDEARKYSREVGSGMPIPAQHIRRERLSPDKIDHFLDFIAQRYFPHDVAYGTKCMKLSIGQTVVIPNVIRTVIHNR